MGTDGKGMCVNLPGTYFAHVHLLVVPRGLEEVALMLRCPSDAGAPVLDRVLGVLVPLVLRSEGAVPPQPMLDMALFGVWACAVPLDWASARTRGRRPSTTALLRMIRHGADLCLCWWRCACACVHAKIGGEENGTNLKM